jgi:DNA-binding MarR family transcriptional regulator
MKLQEAIKTEKFRNARHMAVLNLLYSAYWFKSHNSSLLKDFDLTSEQYNVLRILRGKQPEPMCVKDIGSRMLEKSSNVPRIIDRLVAKKLVKRSTSKEDKRETIIAITQDGLKLLENASKAMDKEADKIIGITEEEAVRLNELLEKLRAID